MNTITKLVCVLVSVLVFACGQAVQSAPQAPIHGETIIEVPTEVVSERFSKMNRPEFNSLGFHNIYDDVDCSVTLYKKGTDEKIETDEPLVDANVARNHATENFSVTNCSSDGVCKTDVTVEYSYDERCGYDERDFAIAIAK